MNKTSKALNSENLYKLLAADLVSAQNNKSFKIETPVESPMAGMVRVNNKDCVMLASNNYLGLANHPRIITATKKAIDNYGFGMSSVRFLCGTQKIHFELEEKIAAFVGQESAILHSSCFSANEAFFTALLQNSFDYNDYKDIIFSDKLNHASIIDGIRLSRIACKNTISIPYEHNDINQLKSLLDDNTSDDIRIKVIATDGVFSMEGDYADLKQLVQIAKDSNSLLFVDESHSTGVLGISGKGTPEHCGVLGEIDIITGTFGKALGGAHGGFIAGRKELVEYLRQKSRPYTFSNTLAPMIAAAAIEAINILNESNELVAKLHANTNYFRKSIKEIGFKILDGIHPIVAIMLGETALAQDLSSMLLDHGVYIKGLWYPVVPKGEARLRAQISAGHSKEHLDKALEAFSKCGKKLGII